MIKTVQDGQKRRQKKENDYEKENFCSNRSSPDIKLKRRQCCHGRSFYVGEAVNEEDVHAKYEDGILKISVPKKEPEKIEKNGYISIEG